MVTSVGYNTIVAANGKQAVDQVRANYDRIAMVLMDCEMPIMDGYEATEAIRAIEAERGVPAAKELFVCAMTANAMREDVKKCFSRRMSGFLAKPVKRSDLETILQENAKRSTHAPVIAASPARARRRSHASDVDGDASGSSSSSASRQSRRANRDRAAVAAVAPGITLAHPSPMHTSHSPSRRKKRGKAAVDQDRS